MRTLTAPELAVLLGGGTWTFTVRVRRPQDALWVNLSDVAGGDWVTLVKTDQETVDQPVGRFSFQLVKKADGESTAVGIATSALNRDEADEYAPLVYPGNDVEIEAANGGDPRLWLKGKITEGEWSGEQVVATCATQDASIERRWIKEMEDRGAADPGTPLEDEIQGLLDRWMGVDAPTLLTIGDPAIGIGPYQPAKGSLGAQTRTLAQRIGWDLRYRWSEADDAFRYTLYLPPRDKATPDLVLTPSDVRSVPGLRVADEYVRNDFSGKYISSETGTEGEQLERTRTNDASVFQFGEQWMEIILGSGDGITTAAQMDTLLEYADHDLSQPPTEKRVQIPFIPWLELHDLLEIGADGINFDFDGSWSVVGISHTVDGANGAYTELDLRAGSPVGAYYAWLARTGGVVPTEEEPTGGLLPSVDPTIYVDRIAGTASLHVNGNGAVQSIRAALSTVSQADADTDVLTADPIDGQNLDPDDFGVLATGLGASAKLYAAAIGYDGPGGTGTASSIAHDRVAFGVGSVALDDQAILAQHLADNAVERAKILNGAVNDTKLAALAVTNAKLALLAVGTANVVDGAMTEVKVATGAITTTKVADDAISTPKLQALSITAGKLAAGAVVAGKISAGAIDATNLIANGIITDALIATGTITGAKLVAGTITATQIAAGTITGDRLSANTITGDKIFGTTLVAIKGNLGTLTTGRLVSPDGDVQINLQSTDGWFIDIKDGSGVVRYRVGHNGYVETRGLLKLINGLSNNQIEFYASDGTSLIGEVRAYSALGYEGIEFKAGGSTGAIVGEDAFGVPVLIGANLFVNGYLSHLGSTAGFFGASPVTKPTGVPVTAAGVHSALVSLGLIAA